jgi:hypothetical protein
MLASLESDYQYRLKDVGPPTRFLGAKVDKIHLFVSEYWAILAEEYLEKAIASVEKVFGKLKTLLKWS